MKAVGRVSRESQGPGPRASPSHGPDHAQGPGPWTGTVASLNEIPGKEMVGSEVVTETGRLTGQGSMVVVSVEGQDLQDTPQFIGEFQEKPMSKAGIIASTEITECAIEAALVRESREGLEGMRSRRTEDGVLEQAEMYEMCSRSQHLWAQEEGQLGQVTLRWCMGAEDHAVHVASVR